MASPKIKNSHHILIAGTGRAGTSVLVQYLSAMGLETILGQSGTAVVGNEFSNAGLEHDLLNSSPTDWPYVIKSPWAYECIDSLLAHPNITLDAVVVPMRDLVESSSSRVILERGAILRGGAESSAEMANWENWATTSGGIIYSLNPVDQGRLLAVGFHHLLCKLIEKEVPIIFLSFPKFLVEPGYLYRTLKSLLPESATAKKSEEELVRILKKDKIRVGNEIKEKKKALGTEAKHKIKYPTKELLSGAAFTREMNRTKKKADEIRDQLARSKLREQFLLLSLDVSEKMTLGDVVTISKYKCIIDKIKKSEFCEDKNLPVGFSAIRYAMGHPDIFDSESDPFQHYIEFGRFEGRTW